MLKKLFDSISTNNTFVVPADENGGSKVSDTSDWWIILVDCSLYLEHVLESGIVLL